MFTNIAELPATRPVEFFTPDRLIQYCQAISAVSSQLLGVAVTVAALVPALFAALPAGQNGYFRLRSSEKKIRGLLHGTALSIFCSGIALGTSVVGQFDVRPRWLYCSLVAMSAGFLLLVVLALISLRLALKSIRRP